MKDILKNYYNLLDIPLIEKNNSLIFFKNDKKYLFQTYNRSVEEFKELLELNEELLNKHIPTGIFILNNRNEYLTIAKNNKYVLLEIPVENPEYNILDMVSFADKLVVSSKKSILYRNNWAELWSSKIDYFEYQIRQLGKDKSVILNSFSYYVGLCENAITYVFNTLKNYQPSIYEKITLQRKRINFPNTQEDYFNPINYVIDIELRDVASYFKSLFFNSYEDLFIEVNAYLKRRKLSIYGYQLLYARLMYPSFYFDMYEQVMEGTLEESSLIPIIKKVDDYEYFLKDMYNILINYAPIERVDWIVNKKEEFIS